MYSSRLGCFRQSVHKYPFILQKLSCNQTHILRNPDICHLNLLSSERRFSVMKMRPWSMPAKPFERPFHSTTPNKAWPPLIWLVLRKGFSLIAILTGRCLKKWWARMPKNERKNIINTLERNKSNILVGAALSGAVIYTYYIIHLVEDPITKRKRFILFTEKQVVELSMIQYEAIKDSNENKIFTSGYQHRHVSKIVQRIVWANNNLPGAEKNWQVLIVNDIMNKNAFVLPSGHIFIFTGILQVVKNNDDQLAAVIAHEMAHTLLSHSAEKASKDHILEMLLLIPILALWAIFPASIALLSHVIMEYMCDIFFTLPFSRDLEIEADTIGLEIMARACFDPRQASQFWKKMERLEGDDGIAILSTHPSHIARYQNLDGLMDNAIAIRNRYCKRSSDMEDMDPRSSRHKTGRS